MILDKGQAILQRDKDGNLIPVKVKLELLNSDEEIVVKPMVKGEIQNLFAGLGADGNTTKEQDVEIVTKFCVNPKFTEEEVRDLKPNYLGAIVVAIMSVSTGKSQKEIEGAITSKVIESLEKKT